MSNSLAEKLLLFRMRLRQDPEAFGKLYDLYVSRIYRFVYFKIPSVEEAQDITSETFLKFWQYVKDGQPVEHVGALLYRIARNQVTDFYRSRGTENVSIDATPEIERLLSDARGLIKMDQSLDAGRVLNALRLLKDEYREVIILRYVDELTHAEISQVLGKPVGNVRVQTHRALETLRALLKQQSPS